MNKIGERDYIEAAQELGCEVAAIKAVAQVEAGSDAELSDGSPKILFEAHHFSRLTNHKYDVTFPKISSRVWNKKLYVGGKGEHFRLQIATKLDRDAALQSASWGMFQIMGFNWAACGYKSLQDFINDMYAGEVGHLRAFVGFIRKNPSLLTAIRKKKWAAFASGYNGPAYRENNYDIKLEQAYRRFLH